MGIPLLSGVSRFLEIEDKFLNEGETNFSGNSAILGGASSKLSLFGVEPVARQTASDLSGVLSALRIYGFIK